MMQSDENYLDFKSLWEYVEKAFRSSSSYLHGLKHARAVEQNGILLANESKADLGCVRLFALFHDLKRENDDTDRLHGKRAAEFVKQSNGSLFKLDDSCLAKLVYACEFHADGLVSNNITIGTCWDADRLDLVRIGVEPQIELLSTEAAKKYMKSKKH